MDKALGRKLYELQIESTLKYKPYENIRYKIPEWFEIPESARKAWTETAERFADHLLSFRP